MRQPYRGGLPRPEEETTMDDNGLQRGLERLVVGAVKSALLDPAVREQLRVLVRTEVEAAVATLVETGPANRLLTVAEAARFAGVAAGTIRDWVAKGRVLAYKAGNRYRIKREDLERAMAVPETREAIDIEAEADRIVGELRTKKARK